MDVHAFQRVGENNFSGVAVPYDNPEPHRYESLSNEVRALCEDAEHNLWVGLKNGKLRVYGNDHSERGYLTEAGTISHAGAPLKGNVYFIYQDSKSNL